MEQAKEKKAVNHRVNLTQDIVHQGGIWRSDEVQQKFDGLSSELSNEQVRRELHKQLQFH